MTVPKLIDVVGDLLMETPDRIAHNRSVIGDPEAPVASTVASAQNEILHEVADRLAGPYNEALRAASAHEHPLTPEARILQRLLHTGALKLRDDALVSFPRSPDCDLDCEELATVMALLRGLESGAEV